MLKLLAAIVGCITGGALGAFAVGGLVFAVIPKAVFSPNLGAVLAFPTLLCGIAGGYFAMYLIQKTRSADPDYDDRPPTEPSR